MATSCIVGPLAIGVGVTANTGAGVSVGVLAGTVAVGVKVMVGVGDGGRVNTTGTRVGSERLPPGSHATTYGVENGACDSMEAQADNMLMIGRSANDCRSLLKPMLPHVFIAAGTFARDDSLCAIPDSHYCRHA